MIVLTESCKENNEYQNFYLGNLPLISKRYQQEIYKLEKEADRSTDLNQAFHLYAKARNLKKEADFLIREESIYLNWPVKVPFVQDTVSSSFVVNGVFITHAAYDHLSLSVDAKVLKQDSHLFMYISAINYWGSEIPDFSGVLISSCFPLVGSDIQFSGQVGHIEKLSGLHKFKITDSYIKQKNYNYYEKTN